MVVKPNARKPLVRPLTFISFAVCVMIGLVVWVLWPDERGPICRGKHVSEWRDIYECNQPNDLITTNALENQESRDAADAIRQARDKVLPFALRWIRYEKPKWKYEAFVFMDMRLDVRSWCPAFIWSPFCGDPGDDSVVYFWMLGPDASPAIPELVNLMNHPSPRVRSRAADALACIGKAALPSS